MKKGSFKSTAFFYTFEKNTEFLEMQNHSLRSSVNSLFNFKKKYLFYKMTLVLVKKQIFFT